MASGPKMDAVEIMMRAQQPFQNAEQRKEEAKKLIKDQTSHDNQVSAKLAKLKALRLEKEAAEAALPKPEVVEKKKKIGTGSKAPAAKRAKAAR